MRCFACKNCEVSAQSAAIARAFSRFEKCSLRQTLGVSIMPPYDTYVLYEVYITPGLIAMIRLFNGMQSSLSMVYDREMGSMRMLLVSPAPRWFLLTSKLIAGVAVSILQVYAFLVVAYFWEIEPATWWGYLTVLPALALSGLMLGALGMLRRRSSSNSKISPE